MNFQTISTIIKDKS